LLDKHWLVFFGTLELYKAHWYCGEALRIKDPHLSVRMEHLFAKLAALLSIRAMMLDLTLEKHGLCLSKLLLSSLMKAWKIFKHKCTLHTELTKKIFFGEAIPFI
jgi:hypothetical protein